MFSFYNMQQSMTQLSSRILPDHPCKVCSDNSSGKHYGIFACDGCAGFFKRSIRRERKFECKSKTKYDCIVDKVRRNQCRACRLNKCKKVGMNPEAVQHERGPRNSTIRKQMAMLTAPLQSMTRLYESQPVMPAMSVLDLSMPRNPTHHHMHHHHHPASYIPTIVNGNQRYLEDISENAARYLFENFRWATKHAKFNELSMDDKLVLLKNSWSDLLILEIFQQQAHINVNTILCAYMEIIQQIHNVHITSTSMVILEIDKLQRIQQGITAIKLTDDEYELLRSILLFSTKNKYNNLTNSTRHSMEQYKELDKIYNLYAEAKNRLELLIGDNEQRKSILSNILSLLKIISVNIFEEIFFRRFIGPVHIDILISDMLNKYCEQNQ